MGSGAAPQSHPESHQKPTQPDPNQANYKGSEPLPDLISEIKKYETVDPKSKALLDFF